MQSIHRRRHRLAWLILTPIILLALVLSYATRPFWPVDEPRANPTEEEQP